MRKMKTKGNVLVVLVLCMMMVGMIIAMANEMTGVLCQLMQNKSPHSEPIQRQKMVIEIDFPDEGWLYLENMPLPGEKWPHKSSEETSAGEPRLLPLNEPHNTTVAPTNDTVYEGWGPEVTIATGIPAILGHEKYFTKLMESIARQTVRANEVVMFLNNLQNENGTEKTCRRVYTELRHVLDTTPSIPVPGIPSMPANRIPLRLACIGSRLTAGHARNAIERIASSDVVAFVDSDDRELPNRNALLRQQYTCFPKRVMVLGELERNEERIDKVDLRGTQKKSCDPSDLPRKIAQGTSLWDMTFEPQDHLYRGLGHGHMSVRRKAVLGQITHTSLRKSEDYTYIQDVLYAFGRNDDAVIVLKQPMTTYIQRSRSTWITQRRAEQKVD